jgi:uncharacterized protein (DUF2164 family)
LKLIIELGPKILSAFRKRNQRQLRKLNDQVLRAASLDGSHLSFKLAVFSYVLSKIVSKPRFLRRDYSGGLEAIEGAFEKLISRARGGNEREINKIFYNLEKSVIDLEKRDARFLIDLVSKGKLKMAATFYAQGMSLGVASDMTGLEKQEILDYAGQTRMFDRVEEELTILERMKIARKFIME